MQRFLTSLLAMTLYLVSNNSSAQQFDSFRQIGAASGIAAGTVTSISLSDDSASVSYFNAAGLSTVYNLNLIPSQVIRDSVPVYMPSAGFRINAPGMNLDDVSFFTGTLQDPQNAESFVPAHWFRLTRYAGVWSGTFRIADRIYTIDRSQPDNIVEVRATPSQNQLLQPERQIKVTAIIDEGFIFADPIGDSIGMDNIGHIYALESLHVMQGVMNDSLGISLSLDQLIYQHSSELASPEFWLENNQVSFGIEDNFASFIFSGADLLAPRVSSTISSSAQDNFLILNTVDFKQLTSAHKFGELLDITVQNNTLQSEQSPLDFAHWSESQKSVLLATLPNSPLIQTITSDAPEIEITEPEEIINEIPQHILDAEIVEIDLNETETENLPEIGNGLLQNDEQDNGTDNNLTDPASGSSGGGKLNLALLFGLLILSLHRRKSSRYK